MYNILTNTSSLNKESQVYYSAYIECLNIPARVKNKTSIKCSLVSIIDFRLLASLADKNVASLRYDIKSSTSERKLN